MRFAVVLLLLAPVAWSQNASEGEPQSVELSAAAASKTLGPGATLMVTFVLSKQAEGGIKFASEDSLSAQLITHPSSDLQVENGGLKVSCPGLNRHPVRTHQPQLLPGGRLGSRTKDDMSLMTASFVNSSDGSITLRYEPFGDTKRLRVLGAEVVEQ